MNNNAKTVSTISEVGILAALGFVFDELQGVLFKGIFPNGGSIGFAMIAVVIVAFRKGFLPALLTGLLMGLFDIATSAYILHPAQILLDYILPYGLVAFAALFRPLFIKSQSKKTKIAFLLVGTILGGLLKFLSHYLSGAIFFSDPNTFSWGLNSLNPYIYSLLYNGAFMLPCILLTSALAIILFIKAPKVLEIKEDRNRTINQNEDKRKTIPFIFSICIIAIGLILFICFLIRYINSFSDYRDYYSGLSVYGYDFDGDSMLIFISGLFILFVGIDSLIKCIKKNFKYEPSLLIISAIIAISIIYSSARLIRAYNKQINPTNYWIWLIVCIVLLTIVIIVLIFINRKNKTEKSNI